MSISLLSRHFIGLNSYALQTTWSGALPCSFHWYFKRNPNSARELRVSWNASLGLRMLRVVAIWTFLFISPTSNSHPYNSSWWGGTTLFEIFSVGQCSQYPQVLLPFSIWLRSSPYYIIAVSKYKFVPAFNKYIITRWWWCVRNRGVAPLILIIELEGGEWSSLRPGHF
jgi:hypothetical protein